MKSVSASTLARALGCSSSPPSGKRRRGGLLGEAQVSGDITARDAGASLLIDRWVRERW